MGGSTDVKEAQRRLMKKYNIHFDGPIDLTTPLKVPENRKAHFRHIKKLGTTVFADYRDSIHADSRHQPWREQVPKRAKAITTIVKRSLDTRRNESGWRLHLEPIVMYRFTVEVACKICRGRLWRSEQEVNPSQQNEHIQNSLSERQKRRQPCRCNPTVPNDHVYEHGISELFDDRADEAIKYPADLQKDLPKRDRPDRIYGLRVTSKLSRLLDLTVDGNLRTCPFKMQGDAIVFPFLVLEAKSEKSADAFTDIQVQTAFAIRELLCIQDGLAKAADEEIDWDGGPLVWFLSCKGEQWRVHAGYIELKDSIQHYRVIRLWDGSIDSLDKALQLLLIIDYIADWARDVYREGVATSLRKLVVTDSQSLSYDPDVYSIIGNVERWNDGRNSDNVGDPVEYLMENPLRAFDSLYGVIRDARFIRTRFIGLYLTENNFREFINSTPSDSAAKILAQSLLKSLEECCRMKRHMLDALEATWTDTDRYGSDAGAPDQIFFVVTTAVFYLDPDWEQTRELGYLAVAESLIDTIFKIADIKRPTHQRSSRIPLLQSTPSFETLLKRGAYDNLSACASKGCIYSGNVPMSSSNSKRTYRWKALSIELPGPGEKRQRDVILKVGSLSTAREFVFGLYMRHRVGRNEPSVSFLRLSTRQDELATSKQILMREGVLSREIWPWANRIPRPFYKDLIFTISEPRATMGERPDLCLFVMDPAVVERGLSPSQLQPARHLKVKLPDSRGGGNYKWNSRNITGNSDIRCQTDAFVKYLQATNVPYGIINTSNNANEQTQRKTLWDILTKDGVAYSTLEDFQFSPNSPYRRRGQQDFDDKAPPMASLPDASRKSKEPNILNIDLLGIDKLHKEATATSVTRSLDWQVVPDKPDERPRRMDGDEIQQVPHPPLRKRTRPTSQDYNEAESSEQGARREMHRALVEETFSRDYVTQEELDELMEQGVLN